MPKRRMLHLTPEQERELVHMRDHDTRPYMRERAAALLKVASGMSPHAVAQTGLLKPRDPDTVYKWLNDYIRNGQITPRPATRGPFSPSGRRARGRARTRQPASQP
jgi:hypothetical protein